MTKLVSRGPKYEQEFPSKQALDAALSARKIVAQKIVDLESLATAEAMPTLNPFRVLSTPEEETKILSETEGRIEAILLTVPPFLGPDGKPDENNPVDPREDRHFARLLKILGPNRDYIVVCHYYQEDRVKKWATDAGIDVDKNVCTVLSVWANTLWAQDAYIALSSTNEDNPILCEGIIFNRNDDMSIADDVAAQAPLTARSSVLYFQGGNILSSHGRTLIGRDYVFRNTGRKGTMDESQVVEAFAKLVGTEVKSLGLDNPLPRRAMGILSGIFQPVFHIDMFVTLTGVVGDLGKEIAFVGRPKIARDLLGLPPGTFDFDEYFAQIAKKLEDIGYEVRSLPLLVEYGDLNGVAPERTFYHETYNNALVENYKDGSGNWIRNVFLPLYGNPDDAIKYDFDLASRQTLDAYAKQCWEDLGFTVYSMDGLEDLAWAKGSIHCMTKVVRRSK